MSELNIYQKLVEVKKSVAYLQKKESGQQYKYVSSSQVLAALREKLNELNILLVPRVIGKNVREDTVEYEQNGKPKRTTTYFTELDIEYTWINADKAEETIVCPWYGQGVDIAGEKGVGKALTYAEKYFMLKFFNIPTDKDDPDAFQQKQEDNSEPQTMPTSAKEGADIVINFGKNKGKTLRDIFKEDKSYLEWLVKQDKTDDRIKTAINMMFQAAQQTA
ncbi:ERF family protein [Bacillus bingmayongensis]|uniref:ERF family protein n=1 Tax=Bacillus bingmayongensis TaxID=1150157 RepID=UPI001C8E5FBF|nr:ERF family protein [Bacillus bingmayongensis]MBY0597726.1 ERF family protein [Bacillus bingmayongensis]